jgi:hypothetical protein
VTGIILIYNVTTFVAMLDEESKAFEAANNAALRKHYSVNAFLCNENTCLTLYRPRKVVTYGHGRGLDKLTIRRAISTDSAQDSFVVVFARCDIGTRHPSLLWRWRFAFSTSGAARLDW